MYLFRERLYWKKVLLSEGCWEWTGSKNKQRYGNFGVWENGKPRTALSHRVGWQLANGEIPAGLCVLHRCDNPGCVNPSHLFLGTIADNMADMAAKGRHRGMRGQRHRYNRRGVKISREIAEDIRAATGTQRQIAERFAIHQSMVSRIKTGECWVTNAPMR